MQDQDVIREFLVESYENLSNLDQELVELEKHPQDTALLASIFRTIHTIKGTCGFFGFSALERMSHQAENLLSQLRDGKRKLTPALISLILETVDATRKVLASIEASGEEGPEKFEEISERLRLAAESPAEVAAEAAARAEAPAEVEPGSPASVAARAPEKVEEQKPAEVAAKAAPVAGSEHEAERGSPEERKTEQRAEERGGTHSAVADANIRVGVGLLDKLMDLVGELVLTRNQILQFNTEREDATLNATSQRLNLITTELQEGVMKTRLQPIGTVWNKLPRVVRDTAVSLGKQIELDMDGADTELDRTIIEAIKDPLVHLVRNACDHGIESPEARAEAGKPPQGRLTLRAYHEGGQVNIEIGDDGAGIDVSRVRQKAVERGLLRSEQAEKLSDREALNLIFMPGFSTAQTVTNLSGRGVGMDVVKSNIEKIGGVVDVSSRRGEGSTVKLKIPLTLAIIPGLVITSGGERFVIPQVSLLELIRLEGGSSDKHIEQVHGTPVYRRRGSLLPIAYLNQVLGLKSAGQSDAVNSEAVNMVVLQAEDRQFGLVVDGIHDTQEIVVKPLGKHLKGLTEYAGATIMGDGCVALILDVFGIGKRSGVLAELQEQLRGDAEQKAQASIEQQRLLLFRSGSFERLAVPLSLVARLEEFPLSSIEYASGRQVVQYRDRILPLVSLRALLEPNAPEPEEVADPVQVIVFHNGDRSVGVVVDQILDVAEEEVMVRQKSSHKGLLGSAVISKRVTDFLDLNEVIRLGTESCFQGTGESGTGKAGIGETILVAEASAFSRGLMRSFLDMAGYRVVEASSLEEAIEGMERQPVDVVAVSLDLPDHGAGALLRAVHGRPELERVPVLALADAPGPADVSAARAEGFDDCLAKMDREALLESLDRLALTQIPPAVMQAQAGAAATGMQREISINR